MWARLTLLILLLSLGGCFVSSEPLIGPSNQSFPVTKIKVKNAEGEVNVLTRAGDHYSFDGLPESQVRLFKVSDKRYVLQASAVQEDKDDFEFLYAMVEIDGDKARFISLMAEDFLKAHADLLKQNGFTCIQKRYFTTCKVPSIEAYVKVIDQAGSEQKESLVLKILELEK